LRRAKAIKCLAKSVIESEIRCVVKEREVKVSLEEKEEKREGKGGEGPE
jgi:hypothetical protein